jgi:hypothetical protein
MFLVFFYTALYVSVPIQMEITQSLKKLTTKSPGINAVTLSWRFGVGEQVLVMI